MAVTSLNGKTIVSRAVPSVTPARIRHAVRQRAGARCDQKRIAVSVIAAGELDDLRTIR